MFKISVQSQNPYYAFLFFASFQAINNITCITGTVPIVKKYSGRFLGQYIGVLKTSGGRCLQLRK